MGFWVLGLGFWVWGLGFGIFLLAAAPKNIPPLVDACHMSKLKVNVYGSGLLKGLVQGFGFGV